MSNGPQSEPGSPSDPSSSGAEGGPVVLDGPSLEDFLGALTRVAADIAPDTHCSITLDRAAHPIPVAPTDSAAAALDEVQCLQGDGPAVLAMRSGVQIDLPRLTEDDRWIELGAYAAAFGIGSGVFLPLLVDGAAIGVLSIYAPGDAGLAEPDLRRARLIADEAAAGITAALRRLGGIPDDELLGSLSVRRVIDQALGVLMHAHQISSAAALGVLLDLARTSTRSPGEAAAHVVANTSRERGPFDDRG